MTSAEAAGEKPRRSGARSRMAALAVVLVLLAGGLVACGDEHGQDDAANGHLGNTSNGSFHPPPIATAVPPAVKSACAVSSPALDRIRKAGVLFWAIGISPPCGFEVGTGKWGGVEAQNAAELATILGVDLDVAEYSYDVLPEALLTGQP